MIDLCQERSLGNTNGLYRAVVEIQVDHFVVVEEPDGQCEIAERVSCGNIRTSSTRASIRIINRPYLQFMPYRLT